MSEFLEAVLKVYSRDVRTATLCTAEQILGVVREVCPFYNLRWSHLLVYLYTLKIQHYAGLH